MGYKTHSGTPAVLVDELARQIPQLCHLAKFAQYTVAIGKDVEQDCQTNAS